ncbi:hypothetical protein [Pedobacter nutrimenti]|jgi:hypothetical protein|uniref:T9SS C-terminal target domain-containing protein n=1 Tax=Pedobacter nutrimenti TaxID=1241337 RepID=A0A318UFK3_9SPHI|nr:hypothetical protein [Pedobacter nutrimenti]PYF75182.1 hypothetical protein B0O44_103632 [Pedobacter nutrimenti]|eukprot:gene10536-12259_t
MVKQLTKASLMAIVAAAAITVSSCKKDQNDGSGNFNRSLSAGFSNPTQNIPVDADGVIQDTFDGNPSDNIINLTSDKVWLLDGVSFVQSGKTLKIAAGTVISSGAFKSYTATEDGVTVTKDIRGVLVIVKGAKIDAVGTESAPIVFTSDKAPGSRVAGDFGGVILLGKAPINQPYTTVIEGLPKPSAAVDITYGGTESTDNSGTLQYVRIEYAGFQLFKDNEINGLTLGGVGNGTTLEHIQVTYSADDSFEFFGGTVNAKWLVAAGGDDDDFDFDFGYSGTIQYAVGVKAVNSTHSTSGGASDANGIESDNNKAGDGAIPRTNPVLKNLTILGTNVNNTALRAGNRWRRNSGLDIQNSIVAGFPSGVAYEGGASGTFSNNLVHAFTTTGSVTPNSTAANANGYLRLGTGTAASFYTSDAIGLNVNLLIPVTTSPANGIGGTYAGAIAPGTATGTTWLKNWTEFATQNKVY